MMHPDTAAILQEHPHGESQFHTYKAPLDDATDVANSRKRSSFSQRLWRLVRDTVLETPRRKVRSTSYCPPSDAWPRSSKRRARSCGHASDDLAHHHHHEYHHHRDGSGCAATGTAVAWRKSKMLQELEASTASSSRSNNGTSVTVAVLRRCVDEYEACNPAFGSAGASVSSRMRSRSAAQRTCRNCAQLFFVRNVEPRVAAGGFCSLDCQSSFEYLRGVQQIVDERMDEDESPTMAAAPHE